MSIAGRGRPAKLQADRVINDAADDDNFRAQSGRVADLIRTPAAGYAETRHRLYSRL